MNFDYARWMASSSTWAAWIALVFGGRIVLSLLPPGLVGSHAPRRAGVRLATSFVPGTGGSVAMLAPLGRISVGLVFVRGEKSLKTR